MPVDNQLEALLLWRDPIKTGIVFTAISLVYILLEWTRYSLLTLIARVGLFAVVSSFLWNNVAQFINKPGVPIPPVLRHGITDHQAKIYAEELTTGINQLIGFTRRLLQGREVLLTVQVAVVLYVIAKVGNVFSTLGLLYTVVVLIFSLPKIYELRKHEIDSVANQVVSQSKQAYSQYGAPYVNKIPRASTSTSNVSGRPVDTYSTADSGAASIAPNGPNEFKKTY